MKIACVGGGPASLYFSILMKLQDASHDVTVHERNPAGSTYGWGVTYWAGLLDKLREGDPASALAVSENSVSWSDGVAHVGDRTTVHPGDEGFGIGRRRMLDLLAERARSLGVHVVYESEVEADRLPDADLVVAGDGINSALRERHADHFGSEVTHGRNYYVWLGTTKVFDSFTFSFVETDHGWIWCYAYRFGDDRSTLVIECSPRTWTGLGLDGASEADGLALLEKLFAELLNGHGLIGRAQADGTAQWLTFRTLTNRTWHRGNLVLLGDAAHTTHYSIGAGDHPRPGGRHRPGRSAAGPPRPRNRPHPLRAAAHGGAPAGAERGPPQRAVVRESAALHPPSMRLRCSPCSGSATRRCCRTSRRSSTTASTARPDGWRHSAA